jgi:hypothetical protein
MRLLSRQSFRLLGISALGMSLLTACPRPSPPYLPSPQLTFQFPELTDLADVKLAALASEVVDGQAQLNVVSLGYLNTSSTGSVTLYGDMLKDLAANPNCTTPFLGGETAGMKEVSVTPDTVRTCNVYFLIFRDADRDGKPTASEELYSTHDLYSYATAKFDYRFVSPGGSSTETGSRAEGWSLVRHQVLQPTATPGRYLVSMNSVPQADEALTLRMHEKTDYFTSQGLKTPGGQP